MRVIWILLLSLGYVTPRHPLNRKARKWIHTLSVPWVGVLSYRASTESDEAIAGIILISTKLALGNAYDVANVPKESIANTTQAMFLTLRGTVQMAYVQDYVLHPEYNEESLNTLALIYLEYNEIKFNWLFADWPKENEPMTKYYDIINVFALGYTDEHGALEQVMYKMEYVDKETCNTFYKGEQLDSEWMTPVHYECFKKDFSKEQCVFESGMVLTAYTAHRWQLLGISVLGPGCSLPTRFIDFAKYVSWVQRQVKVSRRYLPEVRVIWPESANFTMDTPEEKQLMMNANSASSGMGNSLDS